MITASDKWMRLREPFDQLVDSLLVPSWVFDGRDRWREHRSVDPVTRANRTAWEAASQKHVREYGDLLAQAAAGSSLTGTERELLQEVLGHSPEVVHLQSGHGLDDVALVLAGAKSVIGIDYSQVAAGAAQRRADALGAACRYVVAVVPGVPVADGSADLVYTGKGALIWMPDLAAWACDAARLLRPGGGGDLQPAPRRARRISDFHQRRCL